MKVSWISVGEHVEISLGKQRRIIDFRSDDVPVHGTRKSMHGISRGDLEMLIFVCFSNGFGNFRNGCAIGKFVKLPWNTTCGNSRKSLHLYLLLRFWSRAGGAVRRNLLFQSSNLPDPLGPFGIAKVAIGVTIFNRFRRWCSMEVSSISQWRTHSRSCRIPWEYKQKSTFPSRRGGFHISTLKFHVPARRRNGNR